jgi:hypothetical protein
MRNIFLNFFQTVRIEHGFSAFLTNKSHTDIYKSGDRGGHSSRLLIHSLKTASNAHMEFLAVCDVALSYTKCPQNFPSTVGLSKKGDRISHNVTGLVVLRVLTAYQNQAFTSCRGTS